MKLILQNSKLVMAAERTYHVVFDGAIELGVSASLSSVIPVGKKFYTEITNPEGVSLNPLTDYYFQLDLKSDSNETQNIITGDVRGIVPDSSTGTKTTAITDATIDASKIYALLPRGISGKIKVKVFAED